MWTLGGEFSCRSFVSVSFFSNNVPPEFRGIQHPLTGGSLLPVGVSECDAPAYE